MKKQRHRGGYQLAQVCKTRNCSNQDLIQNRLTTQVVFVKVVPGNSGSHEAPEDSILLSAQDRCGGLDPFVKSEHLLNQPSSPQGGMNHQGRLLRSPSQGTTFPPGSVHPSHQDLRILPLSWASGRASHSQLHILRDFNHNPTKSLLLCNCLLFPFATM